MTKHWEWVQRAARVEILATSACLAVAVSALVPDPKQKSLQFQPGMRLALSWCMTEINSFRDLTVWQISMDLAEACVEIVEAIPYPYRFTFADQLIPASISIPSNIAEGSRRPTRAYLNHLSYSLGSHGEVETLIELIHRRKLVPGLVLNKGVALIDPIGKMLHRLVRSLEARANATHS